MMKAPFRSEFRSLGAWTLAELTVAMAISSLLCAALITGTISLQKSFIASRHHILAQAEQMRLIDYMNLDLRRATHVAPGNERMTLTIPDYYDSFGEPRDPAISKGMAVYGPSPKTITYYKENGAIYRQEGATRTLLANDVSDCKFIPQDLGQSIRVSVTFVPKYQFSTKNQGSAREGTATYTTTLLRNKRQY